MNAPEISIFFDTNCLEDWDGKSIRYLSELKVNAGFYTLCKFIVDHDLSDKVEICISEITWMEIKEHLFKCYKETHATLKKDISTHKNRLGDLLNIDYSISHTSEKEYLEHIETITTAFLKGNICKKIPYPRDIELLNTLVEKAVRTQAPFCEAGNNGKKYSDAGFKDALIFETIISHCNQNKTLGVFITKDKDFHNPSSYIHVVDAFDKAKEYLLDRYKLTDEDQIKRLLETSEYLKGKIVAETGNQYDESVLDFKVNKVEKTDESNLFKVDSQCLINETQYIISFVYDIVGKDMMKITYDMQNE